MSDRIEPELHATRGVKPSDRLELRPRMVVQSRQNRWASWMLLLPAVVLLIGTVALLSIRHADIAGGWEAMWTALWQKIEARPFDASLHAFVLVFVLPASIVYSALMQRRERLVLTPLGIEYHSPLPSWLQFFRESWSLSWSQVRAVSLKGSLLGGGAEMVVLELAGQGRKRRLMPLYWVDPVTYRPESPWKFKIEFTGTLIRSGSLEKQIDDSPLMQYVEAALPHITIARPVNFSVGGSFAIEKNRAAFACTVAFFVLLAYAFFDGLLASETYVQDPPFAAFITVGVVMAMAGAVWMIRSKVPVAESVVIALFAGGAAGGAAYPAILRLNALTDMEGLKVYQYEMAPGAEFRPLADGLPALRFPRHYAYWSQFTRGSIHTFELRRGGLGFYQINMAPLERNLRDFNEQHAR